MAVALPRSGPDDRPVMPATEALAETLAPNAATLVDASRATTTSPAAASSSLAATLPGVATSPGATSPATVTRTSTVLPRVEPNGDDIQLVHDGRTRYEHEKILGEGGMGVVALAHDHDIDRRVAVKQIRREVGNHGLARFVEEVRTIGSLEHPNIIPIHDVGVDEQGNYFFVMKYVEGETLETIIEKLAAGDAEAHRRFTFEVRVQIFIGLLRALAYAHERGINHRDVKPANVMVGRYGEVVLMDWGIARPIGGKDLPVQEGAEEDVAESTDTRRRLVRTQHNALVGTPSYMSPEQARGSADLDARSDLYSAAVVFHELLTLRHYLSEKTSVPGVLVGVINENLPPVFNLDAFSHPTQGIPPAELLHFVARAMKKEPEARWQSAMEMIAELERAQEGRVRVQCPMTFTKRIARETGRFVDRRPRLAVFSLMATAGVALFGIGSAIVSIAS